MPEISAGHLHQFKASPQCGAFLCPQSTRWTMLKQIGDWLKHAARYSHFRVCSKHEWILINFNEGGSKANFYFAIWRNSETFKSAWMLRIYVGGYVFLLPARLGLTVSNRFK
jgi:hypothetical protein